LIKDKYFDQRKFEGEYGEEFKHGESSWIMIRVFDELKEK
jgi:hypothetical protein